MQKRPIKLSSVVARRNRVHSADCARGPINTGARPLLDLAYKVLGMSSPSSMVVQGRHRFKQRELYKCVLGLDPLNCLADADNAHVVRLFKAGELHSVEHGHILRAIEDQWLTRDHTTTGELPVL